MGRNRQVERLVKILRQRMPELKERYNVTSLGLFGSYVRNRQTSRSDLDVLVEFAETPNLFEFMDLEQHLTKLLKVKVELVSRKALKGNIGGRILREVIYV
jgi:predicted nucleotidyltransferase